MTDPEYRPAVGYGVALWAALDLVSGCVLAIAVLALAARLRPASISATERFRPRSPLERTRRQVTAALGITLAASAVLRFTALDLVSGTLWVAFVVGAVLYLTLVTVSVLHRVLTLGRCLLNLGP